jgi:ubiquinone/menaquinone biosynthesis C-methylase UbiE
VDTTELMRQDWDERARKDAFHYIASWRKDWDPAAFFKSGEEDYQNLVGKIFDRRNWSPAGKTMLELGCGAGRMTRSFAQRFSRVQALDISSEMLKHAKALFADVPNVDWILSNGKDLAGCGDQTVDFVFSYIVLQHMPKPELAYAYITEMLRILKPGGMFLFQFTSMPRMTMNLKGRLVWRLVDLPWTLGLRKTSQTMASLLGLAPEIAGKSWRGASLKIRAVREVLETSRGEAIEVTGEETPMTWCHGLKSQKTI